MADGDSTKVVYKIRQWSLPGSTVVPVLNVSSRIFWLELEGKALLDSYTVLQASCAMFSHRNALLHGRAPQVNGFLSLDTTRSWSSRSFGIY